MIKTDRLLLKPLSIKHADLMFLGLVNTQLYEYLPELPPPSLESLQDRYRMLTAGASPEGNEIWLNWVLVHHETETAIGYTQVTVRKDEPSLIAYLVFQPYWRSGFAAEAVSATVDYIFHTYDKQPIEAFIDTRNVASQKLASKLGFTCLEKIEGADYFKGCSSDEYRYCLTR